MIKVGVMMMVLVLCCYTRAAEGYWCVARSNASEQALQTALDYACGAGADCAPIQSTGLCYLPNTMQAHASYAFNSYYQRKNSAPGSCDFAGAATVAKTDPSFGSCVYPPNPSTAGVYNSSMSGTTTPSTTTSATPAITTPSTTSPASTDGGVNYPTILSSPPAPITSNAVNKLNKLIQASVAAFLFSQLSPLLLQMT